MKLEHGDGDLDGIRITGDGDVVLKVTGKDRARGRWAAFDVHVPWAIWERFIEASYNDREEIAQTKLF